MGLSRQARIITLLVIDTCFFFLVSAPGNRLGRSRTPRTNAAGSDAEAGAIDITALELGADKC